MMPRCTRDSPLVATRLLLGKEKMTKCQHVIFTTKGGHRLDLMILEESPSRYSVLMSLSAFPVGTVWKDAKDAAAAALRALNGLLVNNDEVATVAWTSGEFVNEQVLQGLI
jgi:hypothetical protein